MKRLRFISLLSLFTIIGVLMALLFLYVFLHYDVLLSFIITAVFVMLLAIIFISLDRFRSQMMKDVDDALDLSYREALNHGDVGILVYDENYQITYMSEFFQKLDMDHMGEKLLNWLPELQEMLRNEANNQLVVINDEKFSIRKIDNANVLTFKDITNEYDLERRLKDLSPVMGYLVYDNYDESAMSEDELSYINTNIKVPVIEYFKNYGVVYNTLKNNRMLLNLNEEIFSRMRDDRFSILNKVRKVSKEGNTDVTISLAFARGSDSYEELSEIAEQLISLAQSRGGDQVVVRQAGGDTTFYGGTTEAREKQSKTKIRVTANSIRDLLAKSSDVIIVGHRDMDADCMGSALCMSNIAMSMGRTAYIVSRSGGLEPMISDVCDRYAKVLENKHNFISEAEAMEILNDDSLVIMVDHHAAAQSNGSNVLKEAGRIIILDHHRRKADLDVVPIMMYIEASASSATELCVELLPYFSKNIEISYEEANIMYLGMLIDTDHFRVRTGSRTFDVAKVLRGYGADPMVCDELSQDPYDKVVAKSRIINAGKAYRRDVIVAALTEGIYTRTVASQACDTMIKAREIEAAFVICNVDKNEVVISARSKGKINVQVIMEQLNGGGHMTAAGLQVADSSVAKEEARLLKVLDDYFKGEENASNNAV